MKRAGLISLIIGLTSLVLAVGLVSAVVVVADDDDDDDRVFTDRSLEGRWGFAAEGTVFPPIFEEATLASAVGTLEFDGEGGCSITDIENFGGFVIGPQTTVECAYSVNPDGTGTLSFAFPNDPVRGEVAFVMLNKTEVRDMRADGSPVVATAVWKKQ